MSIDQQTKLTVSCNVCYEHQNASLATISVNTVFSGRVDLPKRTQMNPKRKPKRTQKEPKRTQKESKRNSKGHDKQSELHYC